MERYLPQTSYFHLCLQRLSRTRSLQSGVVNECFSVYRYDTYFMRHKGEITVHAIEIAGHKIPSKLERRRENIFFRRARASTYAPRGKSRGKKRLSCPAVARGVTTLLTLSARRIRANAERTATRTIAIGRSLFSALLRRERVADLRRA